MTIRERTQATADAMHLRRGLHAIRHAPPRLRALIRADETALIVVAGLIGVAAGFATIAMNDISQLCHELLFRIPHGQRLSSADAVDPLRSVTVPLLGGLAVGLLGVAVAKWWPRRAVDPIEANALYGGRMSLNDSLVVVGQTLLSNGVGASVGLEAGYTQIGSALASRFGRELRVRRSDLRLLVGCGSAAAIAAAFNTPLAGAFYAFELVIGTYTLAALAPVIAATVCAVLVTRVVHNGGEDLQLGVGASVDFGDYPAILVLGIICAFVGIYIMRGVTLTETLFRQSGVRVWLRPAFGGLLVGVLSLATPQVLSSGHGALALGLEAQYGMGTIAMILVLKSIASAVSIGSGFRGGLFFASLFLGSLLGKFFSAALLAVGFTHAPAAVVCAMVGMCALAVAIVGGPLTMGFMALESTGSLPMTAAVLAAVVVSSMTVRRRFGYSFTTWRFHLRGEVIRSAVDVGWIRNLTVGRMMRRNIRTVRSDTPIAAFRRDFPLGASTRVIAVDEAGRYAGLVLVAEAHAVETAETLADVLHHQDHVLLPQMTVKEASAAFEAAESDALAVVDGAETLRVIGLLTEYYALRRYSEELDRQRRDLSGE